MARLLGPPRVGAVLPIAFALALALAVALPSAPARSEDLILAPLLGLKRPVPETLPGDAPLPPSKRCRHGVPPHRADHLPFGPGEALGYDVAYLGFRAGKANLRVTDRTWLDGLAVYPLQAQIKTEGVLGAFGTVDARIVTFLDPRTLLPTRMVNRVTTSRAFTPGPTVSREDGAFAPAAVGPNGAHGGEVRARLTREGPDGKSTKSSRHATDATLVDLLSVAYFLRGRDYVDGAPLCFEVYHRRRLWRVEGKAAAVEVVRPPIGARRARRLDLTVTGRGRGAPPPRRVTTWLSTDDDRVPVLVSTPEGIGHIEVRLLHHQRGRRLVMR